MRLLQLIAEEFLRAACTTVGKNDYRFGIARSPCRTLASPLLVPIYGWAQQDIRIPERSASKPIPHIQNEPIRPGELACQCVIQGLPELLVSHAPQVYVTDALAFTVNDPNACLGRCQEYSLRALRHGLDYKCLWAASRPIGADKKRAARAPLERPNRSEWLSSSLQEDVANMNSGSCCGALIQHCAYAEPI